MGRGKKVLFAAGGVGVLLGVGWSMMPTSPLTVCDLGYRVYRGLPAIETEREYHDHAYPVAVAGGVVGNNALPGDRNVYACLVRDNAGLWGFTLEILFKNSGIVYSVNGLRRIQGPNF